MPTTNTASALQSVAANANDIRDIKPPLEIFNPWVLLLWALGALAVAALAFALWRYWQKSRSQMSHVPPVLAHVRAKQKLQEALALISQPKPFCTLVSDTIRGYLEERFNFHAPERTTEEFLYELQGTDLLSSNQKESLGEFLQSCDLVKFAKYEPGEPELRDLHDRALRLVEETQPSPPPIVTTGDQQHEHKQINSHLSKGSLADDIHKSAEWISQSLKSSGYHADFSPESLWEIDRFFEEQSHNGEANPDGLLAEDLGQRIFALGAYAGEVVRRNKGGAWAGNDSDPNADINVELHLPDGTRCWPVQRVMKRLKNGSEDGIAGWGTGAGLQVGPYKKLQA